jgi:hypothetical protein
MQNLKSLIFTAVQKGNVSPLLIRRAKLIRRLEEQKALFANPAYVAVEQRWETDTEGRKEPVERKRKVRRWWREDITGNVLLTVKYGQKTIEFEKGKAAIALPAKENVPEVLDILISAVRAGELDEQLNTMSKVRPIKRKS